MTNSIRITNIYRVTDEQTEEKEYILSLNSINSLAYGDAVISWRYNNYDHNFYFESSNNKSFSFSPPSDPELLYSGTATKYRWSLSLISGTNLPYEFYLGEQAFAEGIIKENSYTTIFIRITLKPGNIITIKAPQNYQATHPETGLLVFVKTNN